MLRTVPGLRHFVASELKAVASSTSHRSFLVPLATVSPLPPRNFHSSIKAFAPLRGQNAFMHKSTASSRLVFHLLQSKTFVSAAPGPDSSASESSSSSSSDSSSESEADLSDSTEPSELALDENALDTVQPRVQKIDEYGRSYGRGWRKSAKAHVYIKPGDGTLYINGKLHSEYFARWAHRGEIITPFKTTQTLTKFDMYATVKGGGHSGLCIHTGIICSWLFFSF